MSYTATYNRPSLVRGDTLLGWSVAITQNELPVEITSARSQLRYVSGLLVHTFDGDEISQGRMVRAILALPEGQTARWVLYDNTEIDATAAELREALALAVAEQARLWVKTE